MPRKTKARWVEQAKVAIIALLKQQHAVIRPAEVVANIADRARPDGIDLHHLTSAFRMQAKGQPVHILVRG
jgi:hypothetical protein